jgi:hypothetical protein
MTEFDEAAKKIEADRTRVSVTENHKMVVDTPPPSGSPAKEFPKPKPPDPNKFIVVGAIHEMQNPWSDLRFTKQPSDPPASDRRRCRRSQNHRTLHMVGGISSFQKVRKF